MRNRWSRVLLLLLLAAVIAAGAACGNRSGGGSVEPDEEPTEVPTATPVPRDISGDTPIAASIVYANDMANKVNGWYPSYKRDTYVMQYSEM